MATQVISRLASSAASAVIADTTTLAALSTIPLGFLCLRNLHFNRSAETNADIHMSENNYTKGNLVFLVFFVPFLPDTRLITVLG